MRKFSNVRFPESFKEINQVKNKLLTAGCKKSYYEKKWIFLKKKEQNLKYYFLKWSKHLIRHTFKSIQDIQLVNTKITLNISKHRLQ